MFKQIKNKVTCTFQKANEKASLACIHAKQVCHQGLAAEDGAMYVDEGGNMLIAVVVGMLLLVSIYAMFKGGVMPNITSKTNSMFGYTA